MEHFTPAILNKIAQEKASEYEALDALCKTDPSDANHELRRKARRTMEDARLCAAWMEAKGHAELGNVGPFMSSKVRKYNRIHIKPGARIFSTDSKIPPEGKVFARMKDVEVARVSPGYVDYHWGKPRIVQGEVHWAGSGGYWRRTDINNVELA